MAFSHRHKFILTVMGTVGVNLLFGAGATYMLWGEIQKSSHAYQESQEELHLMVLERTQIHELEKQSGEFKKKKEEIENVFLHLPNDLGFIRSVESMARRSGVTHTLAPLSPPRALDETRRIVSSAITVEGAFPSVMEFLYLLEHMQYYVDIQDIIIEQKRGVAIGEGASLPVRAVINIFVYTL